MSKHMYRAKKVKAMNVAKLAERVENKRIIFGIDVAKEDMYAVFMDETREVLLTVKWKHPEETLLMLDILRSLPCSILEAAMEPSGTYGDSVRYQLKKAGIEVYRVGSKKSFDYCEVYDGVDSSHDAKSAAIIARLHLDGMSDVWTEQSEAEMELREAIRVLEMHSDTYYRRLNQLEALLAGYWPELTRYLDLTSVSLLSLLMEYGSPQEVAASPEKARKCLRRAGRSLLAQAKIDSVIASASTTLGRPMIAHQQRQTIKHIARTTLKEHSEMRKAKQKVEQLSQEHAPVRAMSKTVGKVTAAVVYATVGDPADYSCARAYVKGMGLNLKERSSGKHKGQLKITKRGPSIVRRYLYLAVLRLVQTNEYFKKWYERKVERDGFRKSRALIALMRKLAKALWYVGQGNEFNASLLFDPLRLKLSVPEAHLE